MIAKPEGAHLLQAAGGNMDSLARQCEGQPEVRAEMRKVAESWEVMRTAGQYNRTAAPKRVEASQSTELHMVATTGYFWPLAVYKRIKDKRL